MYNAHDLQIHKTTAYELKHFYNALLYDLQKRCLY
jgi:hypothetical protein